MYHVPFSSTIGSIMYAMCTHSDISHIVSVMACYMHNHGNIHWQAMK